MWSMTAPPGVPSMPTVHEMADHHHNDHGEAVMGPTSTGRHTLHVPGQNNHHRRSMRFQSLLHELGQEHEREMQQLQTEIAHLSGSVMQKTSSHVMTHDPSAYGDVNQYEFLSRAGSEHIGGVRQSGTFSAAPAAYGVGGCYMSEGAAHAIATASFNNQPPAEVGGHSHSAEVVMAPLPSHCSAMVIPGAPADEPPPLPPNLGSGGSSSLVLAGPASGSFSRPLKTHTLHPSHSASKNVCLLVTVVSARNLRRADWQYGALSDPYVVLTIDDQKVEDRQLQTRMVAKTLEPVWNHEFIITDFDVESTLHFNVFDKDWGSDDDSLGTASLLSSSFLPKGFEGEILLSETGGSQQSYLQVKVAVASPDVLKTVTHVQTLDVWLREPPARTSRPSHKAPKSKSLRQFGVREKAHKSLSIKDICTWSFLCEQLKKLRSPLQTTRNTTTAVGSFVFSLRRPMEPMSSPRVSWDLIGMVVLLIELCWIPMQVYDPPETAFIQVLSWLTLLYWSSDIAATLNTAYIHKQTGNLVRNRMLIAMRYMKSGWLLFDLLLVSIDWATVIQKLVDSGRDVSAGESAAAARAARVSRVFRFIRLLRLMRLAKLRQVMYMIQEFVDSESLMVAFTVVRNIFAILLLNHILACLFFASSDSENGWVKVNGVEDEDFAMQYVISLQWSLSQFTPGSPQVQGETFTERTFTVSVLALGLIVATVFVSSITSAMGAAWAANRYNASQSFLLRQYLQQNKITHGLAARVTRYVDCVLELRQKKIHPNKVHYLDLLSGPLNFELKVELNVPHLISHDFFEKYYFASMSAMGDVCTSALEHFIYTKTDKVFGRHSMAKYMSFPTNGTLTYRCLSRRSILNGRIAKLEPGHWFTEAALWLPWKHQGQMKAITEVALLNLSAVKFIEISLQYPDAFTSAQRQSHRFLVTAQAQEIFELPLCDIPLDHLTGRPTGVLLNYYDLRLNRAAQDGDIREAEDNDALKTLWQSDSESSSDSDAGSSQGSKPAHRFVSRSDSRKRISATATGKSHSPSPGGSASLGLERSRSLKDVPTVKTSPSARFSRAGSQDSHGEDTRPAVEASPTAASHATSG